MQLDRHKCETQKTGPYPADSSSSNITVSTSNALIALLISETLPEPMYVRGFGEASLYHLE
jgi:hypothetical protein